MVFQTFFWVCRITSRMARRTLHGGCDGSTNYTAGPCKGVTSASGMFKHVTSGAMSLSKADIRFEGTELYEYAGWGISGLGM